MPAVGKLNQLAQDKVTQGVMDYEGEEVHFAFAGGRLTGADIEGFAEVDEAHALSFATELLAKVLVSWDITHEDGTEFPPTLENLNTLQPVVRMTLLASLQKAAISGGEGGSFAGG